MSGQILISREHFLSYTPSKAWYENYLTPFLVSNQRKSKNNIFNFKNFEEFWFLNKWVRGFDFNFRLEDYEL